MANPKKDKNTSSEELKKESVKKDSTHKGYNEKNPKQPEGAFLPDNDTSVKKNPLK